MSKSSLFLLCGSLHKVAFRLKCGCKSTTIFRYTKEKKAFFFYDIVITLGINTLS